MLAALDRYVRDNCTYSILKDKDFEGSRKVLNGKAISLQHKGKGKRPNRADIVTAEGGKHSIHKLKLYRAFYLFGQYFGTGQQEHHQLRIKEFQLTRTWNW